MIEVVFVFAEPQDSEVSIHGEQLDENNEEQELPNNEISIENREPEA